MPENPRLLYDIKNAVAKAANEAFEINATPLQKELLQEHRLMIALTHLPPTLSEEKFDPLAIIVGTAQGMHIVNDAIILGHQLVEQGKASEVFYYPSGKIAVSKGEWKESGIVGPNAEVLATMLEQSGVPKENIRVERESENAPQQGKNLKKLLDSDNIKKGLTVVSTWHGPRFYMTMLNKIPGFKLYTSYSDSDKRRINQAAMDYGQVNTQQAIFVSEMARYHMYSSPPTNNVVFSESDTGALHPSELLDRIKVLIPDKRKDLFEQKKRIHQRLMKSWNEIHDEVMEKENYEVLSDLARPSGDFK